MSKHPDRGLPDGSDSSLRTDFLNSRPGRKEWSKRRNSWKTRGNFREVRWWRNQLSRADIPVLLQYRAPRVPGNPWTIFYEVLLPLNVVDEHWVVLIVKICPQSYHWEIIESKSDQKSVSSTPTILAAFSIFLSCSGGGCDSMQILEICWAVLRSSAICFVFPLPSSLFPRSS